jgi:acyl-coenzyme A thioesterase PaaI-like protein
MQPPRSTFSSDGVELLRARMRGDVPPPAIDQLTGMRLVAADEGEVVFAMPAQP